MNAESLSHKQAHKQALLVPEALGWTFSHIGTRRQPQAEKRVLVSEAPEGFELIDACWRFSR
jgi:hypothetical protein